MGSRSAGSAPGAKFQRYGQWHARLCAQPPAWQGPLLAIAQAVLAELPAVHDAEWDYARG